MHIFNNKVITLVLGAPGSGKSTFAAKLVKMANKASVPIYCNYPYKGALQIDMDEAITMDLGKSVLVVDEAGLNYNSRSTKTFTPAHYHWFATTRHRHTQIFVIVQSWKRVDIILRELATEILLIKRSWFRFSSYKIYHEDICLIEDNNGNATEFQEVFQKVRKRWFWKPKYYHMFDSYHKDREYNICEPVLYPDELFPQKQPTWRLLLGLRPKPQADVSASGLDVPSIE